MKYGALGENQLFQQKFRYIVYMFTTNIFQSMVVKWGLRPVEKRVHARVNVCICIMSAKNNFKDNNKFKFSFLFVYII